MSRKPAGARRRGVGALAAVALCATALVTTSAVSSAEVRTQKSKIDKTAVIRMGVGVGDNGGGRVEAAHAGPDPCTTEGGVHDYHLQLHATPAANGSHRGGPGAA